MRYNILTKIDREILRIDPEFTPYRQWRNLAWARSSIQSAKPRQREKKKLLAFLLFSLKQHLLGWIVREISGTLTSLERQVQLEPPNPPQGSYLPPRYFSKGGKKKREGKPISYLLIETNEVSKPRPVPGKSLFLKSLAKGKGVLKRNEEGLFYLDIDNRFILSLIPYLKAFGLIQPPYFNLFAAPNGAHIPVILPRETALHFLDNISDIGKEFTFEIEGLYSVEPILWPEAEQVWFFQVHSPELEILRQKLFLIARPGGHSFHIAVAIKPRQTQLQQLQPFPIMRVNIAFIAA